MNSIKIFSPATIANISCGFDVLGLALDNIGDEMIIKKINEPGVRITKIVGQKLPLETTKNVAGVAALALLNEMETSFGFEIEIYKNIKPGSGIGSSAASAAGAVWGINELLGKPFNKTQLVKFAMEGEKLASGTLHADNVAPALFGGFTLVRSYNPLDIIQINTPKELFVTVIHPHIEIKTVDARAILSPTVLLKDAVKQWGNVGGLISGLYTEDYELIGRSLEDFIVEPIRATLIPNYYKVKESALNAGALGCGISGSGPSIFALCKGENVAKTVALALKENYKKTGIPFDVYSSKINSEGIKIIK
ncbi:homoserine kinase [Lutibacter sp.]|uniref:homoserine kinase n=1 Tax=Lutibacter sp. TaxID=1925666 RepID=UPI002736794A|nr:homoserine kinase [Lutibacter sp.]MDP3313239.1 homoserine kinase [Lutibacter sp.]